MEDYGKWSIIMDNHCDSDFCDCKSITVTGEPIIILASKSFEYNEGKWTQKTFKGRWTQKRLKEVFVSKYKWFFRIAALFFMIMSIHDIFIRSDFRQFLWSSLLLCIMYWDMAIQNHKLSEDE